MKAAETLGELEALLADLRAMLIIRRDTCGLGGWSACLRTATACGIRETQRAAPTIAGAIDAVLIAHMGSSAGFDTGAGSP